MNVNISKRAVAEFLTGAGIGTPSGVTLSSVFVRPLGVIPLAVVYAASAAVLIAGLWAHRMAAPGTWVPAHLAAPEGRIRRAAVAVLAAARVWPLLPGRAQGLLCGCPACKVRDEVPA